MDLVATVRLVRSRLARKPPFGVEPKTWRQLATLAGAVVAAGDTGDEEQAGEAARALRRFLRDYV
jgi:hypothetical protein